jgi:DNA-directed RNA polymerase I, II, and III subunit RPABC1
MDSAESTAVTAALAPNGAAPADDDVDVDAIPEVPACISSMIDRGGSVESHRLFLARRTALEMLRDRGYSVPEAELARTLPEFRAWWADKPELERLAFSTTLAADPSNKVGFSPLSPPSFPVTSPVPGAVRFQMLFFR